MRRGELDARLKKCEDANDCIAAFTIKSLYVEGVISSLSTGWTTRVPRASGTGVNRRRVCARRALRCQQKHPVRLAECPVRSAAGIRASRCFYYPVSHGERL